MYVRGELLYMNKEKRFNTNNVEIEKTVDQNNYPVQAEYSLQNNTFATGENTYLNESPNACNSTGYEGTNHTLKDTEGIEFSEELSDGGERDEFIKKQTDRKYGERS